MQNTSTYTLGSEKLKDALAILNDEIAALRPYLDAIRRSALRVGLLILGFTIGFIALILSDSLGWLSETTLSRSVIALLVVYSVVLVVFGRDELRALMQLRKIQSKLGLERTKFFQFVGWKEFRRRVWLVLPGGITTIVCAAVLMFAPRSWPLWTGAVALAIYMLGFVASGSLLLRRNVKWLEERVQRAEHLRFYLQEQSEAAQVGDEIEISIPEETYKEIARIERALINRERQQAIKSRKKLHEPIRAVRQSGKVAQKKKQLEPIIRLKVEAAIELLSGEADDTAGETTGGTLRSPIPETSYAIVYTFEEDSPDIVVHDLVDQRETATR